MQHLWVDDERCGIQWLESADEQVSHHHFVKAAESVRRRITSEMIEFFTAWRDQSGVRSA